MSWVFLDDKFHSNRKILRVGNAGAGLYARSLSYCGDHLTDGFLDEAWVKQACTPKLRDKLVTEELWVKVEGGYEIPDYLTLNPSRSDVLKKREARSSAGKKGASRRWGDSNCHSDSHSSSHSSSYSKQYGKAIAKGLGYNQQEGVFSSPDEIALRWLDGNGWDESFDQAAILEEVGRVVRKAFPGAAVRFDELAVVKRWRDVRTERYDAEDVA